MSSPTRRIPTAWQRRPVLNSASGPLHTCLCGSANTLVVLGRDAPSRQRCRQCGVSSLVPQTKEPGPVLGLVDVERCEVFEHGGEDNYEFVDVDMDQMPEGF